MSVNLSIIKNVRSLEDLAPDYELIRKYAHQINPNQAEQLDDIVQDTFIKLHTMFEKYPNKVIDGAYVASALKSVYLDDKKSVSNRIDLGSKDKEAVIPDTEDTYQEVLETKLDEERRIWNKFDEVINSLSWYDRKVYEYSLVMSVLELSRRSDITYNSLIWTINKVKHKLKCAVEI